MDHNQMVARNARRFRLERGLSLGEVARRSGLSKQTLSKLENGVGNPTVDTLAALSTALDVSLRRLVTEWGTPVYLQRGDDGAWEPQVGHEERALDTIYGSGHVRTALFRAERGDDSGEIRAHAPGTLHHVYVVSGRVRVGPIEDRVEVSTGDFVRYPGDVPHGHVCLSQRAVLHVVTTMPQVRQFGPSTSVDLSAPELA